MYSSEDVIVDRQTDRQTDTLITIICAPYRGRTRELINVRSAMADTTFEKILWQPFCKMAGTPLME